MHRTHIRKQIMIVATRWVQTPNNTRNAPLTELEFYEVQFQVSFNSATKAQGQGLAAGNFEKWTPHRNWGPGIANQGRRETQNKDGFLITTPRVHHYLGHWSSTALGPLVKECRKHLKIFHPRDSRGAFHWQLIASRSRITPPERWGNSLTFQSCIFISEGWGPTKAPQKALGNASISQCGWAELSSHGPHVAMAVARVKGIWGGARRTTLVQQQCPKQDNSTTTAQLTISLESPLLANTEEMKNKALGYLTHFAFIKKARLYF